MKILYWVVGFLVLGVIILLGAVDLTPYLSLTEEMKIAETVPTKEKAETDPQRLASSKQLSFYKIEAYEEPHSREIESQPLITSAPEAQLNIDKRRPIQTPQAMQSQLTPQPEKNESPKQQIETAQDIWAKKGFCTAYLSVVFNSGLKPIRFNDNTILQILISNQLAMPL